MPEPPNTSAEGIAERLLKSWVFVILVSVVIVGLLGLASWPWSTNRFVLKVATRAVAVAAAAPGVHVFGLRLPPDTELRILGADTNGLPPEIAMLAGTTVAVRLWVSHATLQSITLPSGAGLIVRAAADGSIDIGVLNDGSISLALAGRIERIGDRGERTMIANIDRAVGWDITPLAPNVPARLVVRAGGASFALYNQPITDIWFRPPRAAGADQRTFQSEIVNGELQLLDTAAKIALDPRELVLLEGGSRMLSRLEVTDGAVAVDVTGVANRISVGPPRPGSPFRLDRDLTPSLLAYLVGQHELKMLWGIAAAVLGAMWKARQWALKWGK